VQTICRYPEGGLRIGNHVLDSHGSPWLFASLPDAPSGALWHRTDAGWHALDLASALKGLNTRGGRATSLTRDDQGRLHFILAAHPDKLETTWYDPSLELFHLTLDPAGKPLGLEQITETDGSVANWLPALELWDWTREQDRSGDGLWMAYTRGLNAGGIGGDNRNALFTEVHLQKLAQ
jgi:hypothetical protein